MTIDAQAIGAAGFIASMAGRESLSGPGSTLAATVEIRQWMPSVIERHGIKSIADVPCGDWTWMREVDLRGASYAGYDLCDALIDRNGRDFPQHLFAVLNAITDVPPRADLIICRDFLVHLTFAHAALALDNFRASGAKYLAATTFPGTVNQELCEWSTGWGWRPLDMEAEPFGLGQPIDGVKECFFGDQWDRWTRMYRL